MERNQQLLLLQLQWHVALLLQQQLNAVHQPFVSLWQAAFASAAALVAAAAVHCVLFSAAAWVAAATPALPRRLTQPPQHPHTQWCLGWLLLVLLLPQARHC
jgi:Tfp pilus assembly protein PilV